LEQRARRVTGSGQVKIGELGQTEEVVQMIRSDSGAATVARRRPARRRAAILTAHGVMVGTAAIALAACGGSSSGGQPAGTASAAAQAKTQNITVIGKIDADKGPPGTFTGKEHWPAFAPATIHVTKGATVKLTIKEYDDMATALPAGSQFNTVTGGKATFNGAPLTNVTNQDISHTITIPELGINIPLPKAPEGGVATVVFTFKATKAGTFVWQCMTPCGGGSTGMGGAMVMPGWMKGSLVVN
jgi:hypothetical protein